MLLVLTLMIFVLLLLYFFPYMYIIDIVKRGSAYKHLLLLLPFQSDIEKCCYMLIVKQFSMYIVKCALYVKLLYLISNKLY